MQHSRRPPALRRHARRLALGVSLGLALAGCADDPASQWWPIGLGHSAVAAQGDGTSSNAAGNYLAGRAALEAGDLSSAADDFEDALAASPGNADLRRQVFELRLGSGEFDRALETARLLDESGAATDEVVLLLALDAARGGRHQDAVTRFERLSTASMAGPVQPMLLAWARFAAGSHAEAIEALTTPDQNAGLQRLQVFHRAAMLGLDGRPRDGLDALAAPFPDLAEAPARVLRSGLALQLAVGDRAAADQLLAKVREKAPDEPELERLAAAVASGDGELAAVRDPLTGMGDALISIAEAFFEQDRNAEALTLARSATFVTPDDPEGWLLVARVELAQDNPAEALRALDLMPADSPFAWTAGLLRARALQDQEHYDDAVALLETMAQDSPTRPDSLVAMGDLLRGEDRFAEAEAAYTRALERVPVVDRRHWRLFYARGIAFERTKRWPQAEADLLKALELEPEQPFVLNYLGYSWVDQGLNLDRAKGMLHRAVELQPEDGFIVDSLGWAYFRLGEHDKAVTYLERAVELEPGDPVINDHLGDGYWKVGRMREARFQWQRALTFEPEADVVAVIQAKLANGLSDAPPAPG